MAELLSDGGEKKIIISSTTAAGRRFWVAIKSSEEHLTSLRKILTDGNEYRSEKPEKYEWLRNQAMTMGMEIELYNVKYLVKTTLPVSY